MSAGKIQVIIDGTDPNTASFVQNYAQGVWSNWIASRGAPPARRPSALSRASGSIRSCEAAISWSPGVVAIIMTLVGTLLTALVVAREWERGTMEAMMATPIATLELLLGKLIPYFVLGLAAMALCAGIAVFLFGVPFRGSFLALLAISAAFLLPAFGLGLLISSAQEPVRRVAGGAARPASCRPSCCRASSSRSPPCRS